MTDPKMVRVEVDPYDDRPSVWVGCHPDDTIHDHYDVPVTLVDALHDAQDALRVAERDLHDYLDTVEPVSRGSYPGTPA